MALAGRGRFVAFFATATRRECQVVQSFGRLLAAQQLSVSLASGEGRHIVCHIGPTNSGKTHAAIQAMLAPASTPLKWQGVQLREGRSKKGIYCAPLRLLAQEMWVRLQAEGHHCRLVTGEIIRESAPTSSPGKDAGHQQHDEYLACTVEMADFRSDYDVAVIDEAQMASDATRGWAFTSAIRDIRAHRVYVCGEPGIVDLVRSVVHPRDRVEVREFQRLTPLTVMDERVPSLQHLQPGDAVIAFSRTAIYDLKAAVEQQTGHPCAVVYGRLPIESRGKQAAIFNEPASRVKVLLASDAVGMGLNLFETAALGYVKECIEAGHRVYTQVGQMPNAEQIEALLREHSLTLPRLLTLINGRRMEASNSFICSLDVPLKTLALLNTVASKRLSTRELVTLMRAPIDPDDRTFCDIFMHFVEGICMDKPRPLPNIYVHPSYPVAERLHAAESVYRALDLYQWMAVRYPTIFPEQRQAEVQREEYAEMIGGLLEQTCRAKPRRHRS